MSDHGGHMPRMSHLEPSRLFCCDPVPVTLPRGTTTAPVVAPGPRPNLGSRDSGSFPPPPGCLVWCYCWLFLSGGDCCSVSMDLEKICISRSRLNSRVTCVGSLLFLGADVTCRAGGSIGGPVLSVLKAWVRGLEWGWRAELQERL